MPERSRRFVPPTLPLHSKPLVDEQLRPEGVESYDIKAPRGEPLTNSLANSAETPAAGTAQPTIATSKGLSTYAQILRSSAIIGGSSAANMAIGLVRTKAMALMLGPAGFGLMGALTTVVDLTRSLAEMGINNSGVRQIAEASASGDTQQIARTITVLRRSALVLGVIGAIALAALSRQVAEVTFGNTDYAGAITLLSLAVFFRLVADGQGALLQGMRRVGDVARIGVIGALAGTALSIPLVYWLREQGVALSLVVVAAVTCVVSWRYSRRIEIEHTELSAAHARQEVGALLRLGLAFMASSLVTVAAAYVVRIVLIRQAGLEAAGLYQAAWTIGGLYVTFVLQAMGTDFYPRLVGVASDNSECNRLVNEQAHVSLLLAGTGVLATLTFAPWVVSLLYSEDFQAATDVLRWICLGMALRVVTWPLGYVLVARGEKTLFVGVDLAWAVVNVALTVACVRLFGLTGAGIAFFGSYVFHLLIVYPITRRLTGFRWSLTNVRTGILFVGSIATVHAGFFLLGPTVAMTVGILAVVGSALYAVYSLRSLVAPEQVPKKLAWLLGLKPQ